MKTKISLVGILFLLVLESCDFRQSYYKDLKTDAISRGDGISCDKIKIVINENTVQRNTFIYGEKIYLHFTNIEGLTKVDGKTYPKASLLILKNDKDTVDFNPNLFNNDFNGFDLSPLEIRVNFMAIFPIQNHEKYKLYIKIWDSKGKGTFTYEMPFEIQENKALSIHSTGLNYSQIYLWNKTQKQIITDIHINIGDTLNLIIEGVKGLKVVNGKVHPILSYEVVDEIKKEVLSNTNMYPKHEKEGLDPKDFENSHYQPWVILRNRGIYHLRYILKDANSQKQIEISFELETH
jgi:hypothetical protein